MRQKQFAAAGAAIITVGILAGCGTAHAPSSFTNTTNQTFNIPPNVVQSTPSRKTVNDTIVQSPSVSHAYKLNPANSFHLSSGKAGWDFKPTITSSIAKNSILHTDSGGRTWAGVTPSQILKTHSVFAGGTSLGGKNAWFVSTFLSNPSSLPQRTSVWHTANGGQAWSSIQLPKAYMTTWMSFINSKVGWMLASTGPATIQEPCDLYSTANGGQSWQKINTHGDIPITNLKTGIVFKNAKTGWITLDDGLHTGKIELLVTHDGGHTWSPQDVQIPTPIKNQYVYADPPQFATSTSGVMPVNVGGGKESVLYFTNNGGRSWTASRPVPISKIAHVTIVGNQIAWVADGSALYATKDMGRRWIKLSRKISLKAHIIGIHPLKGGTSAIVFTLQSGKVLQHHVKVGTN